MWCAGSLPTRPCPEPPVERRKGIRRLLGYADRISVEPGETINFKVSSEDEGTFHGPVRSSLKVAG